MSKVNVVEAVNELNEEISSTKLTFPELNEVEVRDLIITKLLRQSKSLGGKCDKNNIYVTLENFVFNGDIARSETHVDFNVLTGNCVTWCLDDEPVQPMPSVYVRRIGDVRKILRLQKQKGDLVKSRDTYEKLFYEEERENTSLKMEVEQLNKKIKNLMMPTNAKPFTQK